MSKSGLILKARLEYASSGGDRKSLLLISFRAGMTDVAWQLRCFGLFWNDPRMECRLDRRAKGTGLGVFCARGIIAWHAAIGLVAT